MVKLEVSLEPGSSPAHTLYSPTGTPSVDPTCLHCQLEDEVIHHVVCRCSAFYYYRVSALSQFRRAVIEATDPETWTAYFTHWGNIVKILVCPDLLIRCNPEVSSIIQKTEIIARGSSGNLG